ncbi:MAG: efflux transporter periplasmic adaptor subunit, partial [Acidobacteria bacterium]|nr:efflux transporter periplasmic adaptor subunit [Acidobacteriota bacterium]
NAKAREARYAPLAAEDAISKQDYDDAVSQLEQAGRWSTRRRRMSIARR